MLIIPLEDPQGNPLGVISVDSPRDGLRPDRATIEALEIFAMQASLAIANHARFAELRTKVDSLTTDRDRQQRLISVTQNDLPILLRKDLDQTIAIHNLDQRGERVRAGLAITELVSRQLDCILRPAGTGARDAHPIGHVGGDDRRTGERGSETVTCVGECAARHQPGGLVWADGIRSGLVCRAAKPS